MRWKSALNATAITSAAVSRPRRTTNPDAGNTVGETDPQIEQLCAVAPVERLRLGAACRFGELAVYTLHHVVTGWQSTSSACARRFGGSLARRSRYDFGVLPS
jgi:hypothetical protein